MLNESGLKELLARKGETPRIELKLRYVLSGQGKAKVLDEVAKDIIALTNSAGRKTDDYAYLIIGAGDTLKSDGTRKQQDVRQYRYEAALFLNITNARCTPASPNIHYEEVEVDGNCYGIVSIPPSPHMHTLSKDLDTPKGVWRKGSVLIRHGDEVAVASYEEMVVMMREKQPLNATDDMRTEISDVLSRVQSKSMLLSQSVVETLALARRVNHRALAHICAKELAGWDSVDIGDESNYRPTYRLMEVFVGTEPIDLQYVGFGDYSNTLGFLRHSGKFTATKMFMVEPLNHVEAMAPADPGKSIGSNVVNLSAVNPNAKQPERRVYLYFSPFNFESIIEAVRTEITKHLIDLLPDVRA